MVKIVSILGMSEAAAVAYLSSMDIMVRIAERDGRPMILTRDIKENRINLSIDDGKVTGAYLG